MTAVARGNQKVFEEIGREFARFCADVFESTTTFNADHLAQFATGLRPGDPPDGQRYLKQAFARYYQAFFESDLKTRLELLLLANLEIGFHEQTRLQPEIAAAMDAAIIEPKEFTRRLLKALFPYRGWLARFRLWLTRLLTGPTPLDRAVEALLTEARRLARLFITEHMMSIDLAGTRLKLGDDLTAEFPPELATITHADLRALLDADRSHAGQRARLRRDRLGRVGRSDSFHRRYVPLLRRVVRACSIHRSRPIK